MSDLQTIIYADDERDIRTIAVMALSELGGLQVEECSSGLEALERSSASRPDLIVLDVMMPGMDGVETYKRLRELPGMADTPVVFMTAKAMRHELDALRKLGVAGVIAKPFDPLTLPAKLQEIWGGRKRGH
jgi:two-component system, OmpR family, response regulator